MRHHRFCTVHADNQLLARYCYEATRLDWIAAFLSVVEGRTWLLARQLTDGFERHLVQVGKVAAILVYDPKHALFVTALPKNCRCRRS